MTLATIPTLLVSITIASVGYDIFTHDERMRMWEILHPGQTYLRGYRKLQRKMDKHSRWEGK